MLDNCEFIIVDPASSAKPKANFSVAYWCRVSGGVCFIHGLWFGQCDLYDLAKYHFQVACPTEGSWGFAGHRIPAIFIEGEATCSTIRKHIEDLSHRTDWRIEPIPVSNEPQAKVRRIARAQEVMVANRVQIQIAPNPDQQLRDMNEKGQRYLENQLKASGNDYKDSSGRDDFADLLGLAVDLVFGATVPLSPVERGSGGNSGTSLDFIHGLKPKTDDGESGAGGLCTG